MISTIKLIYQIFTLILQAIEGAKVIIHRKKVKEIDEAAEVYVEAKTKKDKLDALEKIADNFNDLHR